MTLKCSHCGAPLTAAADQTVVTCGYCHTATKIRATRHVLAQVRAHPARIIAFSIGGVVVAGVIAALLARPSPPAGAPAQEIGPAVAQPSRAVEVPAPPVLVPPAETDAGREPEPPSPIVETPPAPAKRPKQAAPVYSGPIVTKKEAEQIVKPELLACMKEHGVHYLITRLGNERRGASVPPLGLTGISVVDYKPTPGFARTPLGRCVARAGSAVRAPAYRGDYIYFGLRQDAVPDPMADFASRLDHKIAQAALSKLDDEARDCATRSPAGSRPGESVRMSVFFAGATGQVSKVEPYYIDARSAYARCLSSVYRKASVEKFREIEARVVHALEP